MGTKRKGLILQGIILDDDNNKVSAIINNYGTKYKYNIPSVLDALQKGVEIQHAIVKDNQLYFDISYRKNDYTGQMFGKWKVMEYIGCSETSVVGRWLCYCTCGCNTIRAIKEPSLQYGESQSCNGVHKFIDMTGKIYGPWKVIRHLGNDRVLCERIDDKNKTQELVGSQLRYTYGVHSQLTDNAIFPYKTADDFKSYIRNDLTLRLKRKPTRYDIQKDLGYSIGTIIRYLQRFELEDEVEKFSNISYEEAQLTDYIKTLGLACEVHNRQVLHPQEIDVYIADKRIGIEYNGDYWHSTHQKKDAYYHIAKTQRAKEKQIRLIHIFEHEWLLKQDKIKNYLASVLNVNQQMIHARKCVLKQLNNLTVKDFIDENHLQGHVTCSEAYGLYYEDMLLEVMTFGGSRFTKENCVELLRLCTKNGYIVVGGAGKLFQHYIKTHTTVKIVSYCDLSKFTGTVYEKLGFKYSHTSNPNYVYTKMDTGEVLTRYQCQKHRLVEQGFDANLSEEQIMLQRGFNKIYDCGNAVYIYESNN